MEVFCVMLWLWNLIGVFILGITSDHGECLSTWRLNPIDIYQCFKKVNYFGCFWLTLLFNLICPVVSVCYWFYKLCTVGRKN